LLVLAQDEKWSRLEKVAKDAFEDLKNEPDKCGNPPLSEGCLNKIGKR
jgi:hypothetical protein